MKLPLAGSGFKRADFSSRFGGPVSVKNTCPMENGLARVSHGTLPILFSTSTTESQAPPPLAKGIPRSAAATCFTVR